MTAPWHWRKLAPFLVLGLPLAAQEASPEDLQDLAQFLEQPVQAASKRLQRLKEAPADVTVLRGDDLLELGYRTLADALGGALGAARWQAVLSGMQRRGSATGFAELSPATLPAGLDREERQSAYLRVTGPAWALSGYAMDRTQGLASAPFNSVVGSDLNDYHNRISFAEAPAWP